MIGCVANYDIEAERLSGAPGVYVDNKKGWLSWSKSDKGKSYHGMSLNVDMEPEPFQGSIMVCWHGRLVAVTNHGY